MRVANAGAAEGDSPVTSSTLIADVIGNPLLEDYGRFLFPIAFNPPWPGDTLADVAGLLTWHSFVNTGTTVDVVGDLLGRRERGEVVFHSIYTEAEKASDPTLRDTGIFVSSAQGSTAGGRPRVAVCSAGGGFAYVGSIHDSMPHALWLSRHGYTAFTLQYRPDLRSGCADLARAISFIHSRADELDVDPACYSLWGGSAGARLAAALSSYGPARFGGGDVPGPGTAVMQYAGHSEITGTEPPTYACVGTADGIVSWRTMQARTDVIAAAGTPSEFHAYDGLPHSFGLGIGTAAEGWIEDAAAFWQKQIDAASPATADTPPCAWVTDGAVEAELAQQWVRHLASRFGDTGLWPIAVTGYDDGFGALRSGPQRPQREGYGAVGKRHRGPVRGDDGGERRGRRPRGVDVGHEGGERGLRRRDLAPAQLDLEGGPTAVVEFHDDVRLLAGLIAVVVDAPAESLGEDPQVLHHLGLEPQSGGLQVLQEPLGGRVRHRGGERGVDEVQFRGGAHRVARPQVGRPGRLLLDDEQAFEGVHVGDGGLGGQGLPGHVLGDGAERRLRPHVPGEGAHERAQAHGVPARFAVQTADVDIDDVLDVVAQVALRLAGRQIVVARPSAVHQVVQGLGHVGPRVEHRFRSPAVEQARQADAAVAPASFEQGHGPHPDP